ncbi:MAG: 16S rRNA (guanine966-N2)-methyltransferase [Planctomycetota bacterium]|jgi:16S rRNA (guanine966-N2)-methyltransferase
MRIIAGKYGGINLKTPTFSPTRPTTNIAKEALFNMIDNYYNFDNVSFLDLFGGTGQMSYEFASRGCIDITTVDKFAPCVSFMNKTIERLQIEGMKTVQMDVFKYMKIADKKYDLIFAGPPYPLPTLDTIPDVVFENELVDGKGWFILEHNPQHNFDKHPNFWKKRNYGQTIFSIFVNVEKP